MNRNSIYRISIQLILIFSLGIIGCSSGPSDEQIVEDYLVKCMAEDSQYRDVAEDFYKDDPDFSSRLQDVTAYMGSGTTDQQKAEYIQSLPNRQIACAYLVKLNLAGQTCTEEAYVDEAKNFSRDRSTRKCMDY